MLSADSLDSVSDYILELLFNIPADNKNHFIKACFDRIMNRIIHDNMTLFINRLQLFDTTAKTGTDTSSHDK